MKAPDPSRAYADTCFFCGEFIPGKRTREHVIPQFIQRRQEIKRATIDSRGVGYQYAQVTVPAHEHCNTRYASEYENVVKSILESFEAYKTDIMTLESSTWSYGPSDSPRDMLATWLMKIYYGLFYHDVHREHDPEKQEHAQWVVGTRNFGLVRNSYKNGHSFHVPSSLVAFISQNEYSFDLRTMLDPPVIMMKLNELVLVLAIGDGFLVNHYLGGDPIQSFRDHLSREERGNDKFPGHVVALAEVAAIYQSLPKSPSFIFDDGEMTNLSFMTLARNPQKAYRIDADMVRETRREILEGYGIYIG